MSLDGRGVAPHQDPPRHEVYVVRHGATEWSKNGRHTGRTDLPLLPEGREEAVASSKVLAGREFALVLVSPLSRAQDTCELAGYLEQAETTADLLEWDYGEFEGITTAEIRTTRPDWSIWDGPVPGGETIEQVAARADRVIARARAAGGDVALFAHGHILRVLTARWCEMDPHDGKRFPLATATVSVLGWEHEYPTLNVWNQH